MTEPITRVGIASTAVPTFRRLLTADARPRRAVFNVEAPEGWDLSPSVQQGYFELRRMGHRDSNEHQTCGVEYGLSADGRSVSLGKIDVVAREAFLVAHTCIGGVIYRAVERVVHGTDELRRQWEETHIPARIGEREAFFANPETQFEPEVWAWLVAECERENGADPESAKNSPTPSAG